MLPVLSFLFSYLDSFKESQFTKLIIAHLHIPEPQRADQSPGMNGMERIQLEIKPSARIECLGSIASDGTIKQQRIFVRNKQCQVGFKIKHITLHIVPLSKTNIGRVTDDDIPHWLSSFHLQHILLHEDDMSTSLLSVT